MHRTMDLRNVHCRNASQFVKILVGQWQPFLFVDESEDGVVSVRGPTAMLLDRFCERTKMGYELIKEGGDWIDVLHRKEADMELGPSVINYDRFQLVGYTSYLTVEQIAILSSSDSTTGGTFDVFLSVDGKVWILFLGTVCLLCILAHFIEVIYLRVVLNKKIRNILDGSTFYFEFFTIIIGNSLNQIPTSNISRITIGMALFMIFFMTCLLTSLISTDLVVQKGTGVIDSLEDLVARPKVCPYMLDKSPLQNMFLRSTEDSYVTITKRIEKCEHTPTLIEILKEPENLERLANGKYAFVDDEPGMYEAGNKLCGYFPTTSLHISKAFSSRTVAAVLRPNLDREFVIRLNEQVSRLVESGIFLFTVKQWAEEITHCFKGSTEETTIDAVKIEVLEHLFYMFLMGNASGGICLVLEVLIGRFCSKKEQRSEKKE